MSNIKTIIWDIVFIILIIGCYFFFERNTSTSGNIDNKALSDTLRTYRDKENKHVAEIKVLEGSIDDLKRQITTKDSTIIWLQSVVNRKTRSATVAGITTNGSITTVPTIYYIPIPSDSGKCDTIYAEYRSHYEDEWITLNTIANRYSVKSDYAVRNKLEIVQEYRNNGLFKPKDFVVQIRNLNPHTETTELRSFSIPRRKPNRILWLMIGVGVGVSSSIILLK